MTKIHFSHTILFFLSIVFFINCTKKELPSAHHDFSSMELFGDTTPIKAPSNLIENKPFSSRIYSLWSTIRYTYNQMNEFKDVTFQVTTNSKDIYPIIGVALENNYLLGVKTYELLTTQSPKIANQLSFSNTKEFFERFKKNCFLCPDGLWIKDAYAHQSLDKKSGFIQIFRESDSLIFSWEKEDQKTKITYYWTSTNSVFREITFNHKTNDGIYKTYRSSKYKSANYISNWNSNGSGDWKYLDENGNITSSGSWN